MIPDFRWPGERLALEADSRAWHDNPIAPKDDAERQALLEAHGDRLIRVTWDQAVAKAGQTLGAHPRRGCAAQLPGGRRCSSHGRTSGSAAATMPPWSTPWNCW